MTIKDESVLDERIRGYDWEHAFQCCGAPEIEPGGDEYVSVYNSPSVSVALGSTVAADPFQRNDVKRVIAAADGENDGADWIGIFELNDGRFAFLSAGCDYTGWDCQSGGGATVSHSLDHLLQFGTDESARVRLGL